MLPRELIFLWIEQVCWGNNDVKHSKHFNETEGRYTKFYTHYYYYNYINTHIHAQAEKGTLTPHFEKYVL